MGDHPGSLQAAPLRLGQDGSNAPQVSSFAYGPNGIDERQARPIEPFLAQVEGIRETRQTGAHGSVANEQHRIRIGLLGGLIQGQRHHLGGHPMPLAEQNLRQSRARPRADIQGHSTNPRP